MSEPGMGPYPPQVALALRDSANQQSTRKIGVSTPCGAGRCRYGRTLFSSPGCRSCRGMPEPGMGTYPPRVALALCALVNQRSARGIGALLCAGRCRPGRTGLSSPGCRSYGDMEGCRNRGWVPILPGCGGTGGGLHRGSTPAARASPRYWPRAGRGGGATGLGFGKRGDESHMPMAL